MVVPVTRLSGDLMLADGFPLFSSINMPFSLKPFTA